MNGNEKRDCVMDAVEPPISTIAVKKFRQPLIAYLMSGLEDNDKWVRVMALQMLGVIGDQSSAESLKPFLVTSDRDLRIIAARSLAMIHSPHMAFTPSPLDNCENCMVRLVADEALKRLKFGNEIARCL